MSVSARGFSMYLPVMIISAGAGLFRNLYFSSMEIVSFSSLLCFLLCTFCGAWFNVRDFNLSVQCIRTLNNRLFFCSLRMYTGLPLHSTRKVHSGNSISISCKEAKTLNRMYCTVCMLFAFSLLALYLSPGRSLHENDKHTHRKSASKHELNMTASQILVC